MLVLLAIAVAAMLFAPWQQSVRGSGRVVAYAPLARQQAIEAPITGRIVKWNEKLFEGARLQEGEFILEIRDMDPDFVTRLETQRSAAGQSLVAAGVMVTALEANVQAYEYVKLQVVEAAEQQVQMARQKVEAAKQGVAAATAAEEQTKINLQRRRDLIEDGLVSQLDLEMADRAWREAVSKLREAEANLASARYELDSKEAEARQKEREAQAKIDKARAELQTAVDKEAQAQTKLADIEVKLARQSSQVVTAPRDGTVLRLLANQGGEVVKAGDPLVVLVPEQADRAVEIWLSGNDAPLVTRGRHVRLQFEGWPAGQFAGWPSVAGVTCGGEVVNVDATDNGRGQFRILVVPEQGQQWPSERFLRQGVRANGWVLLDQVSLGYEFWRRLNGFPPVVSMSEPNETSGSEVSPRRKTKS